VGTLRQDCDEPHPEADKLLIRPTRQPGPAPADPLVAGWPAARSARSIGASKMSARRIAGRASNLISGPGFSEIGSSEPPRFGDPTTTLLIGLSGQAAQWFDCPSRQAFDSVRAAGGRSARTLCDWWANQVSNVARRRHAVHESDQPSTTTRR
jgi:hypothetical protein